MRAVLFDLDDTLLDHTAAAAVALDTWVDEQGISGSDLTARWAESTELHYGRYARREITFAEQRRARIRSILSEDLSDDAADELFAAYLIHYESAWKAFDDALPALQRARGAGLAVGVLTNGDERQQARKLELLGLTSAIDALIASSTLPAGKPDARAFHEACRRLGSEPRTTLMVGDSPASDVQGALDAGLTAVLLDRSDRYASAPHRIRSLNDLTFA